MTELNDCASNPYSCQSTQLAVSTQSEFLRDGVIGGLSNAYHSIKAYKDRSSFGTAEEREILEPLLRVIFEATRKIKDIHGIV